MKKLLFTFLLLMSTLANAETLKVYNLSDQIRIVLSEKTCIVDGLTGKRAAAQVIDGTHFKGCYKKVTIKDKEMYHIDWYNPAIPGDFSEFPIEVFINAE